MNILKLLSRLGLSFSAPKWLISFQLRLAGGMRGVTLGVRVIIFNANNEVFLVKHSYLKGWYFPGGGVEPGELLGEAAKREVREEAQMRVKAEPELYGVFLNRKYGTSDYVACYIVRDWEWDSDDGGRPCAGSADGEIIDADFFPLNALPEDVSDATQARLKELSGLGDVDGFW